MKIEIRIDKIFWKNLKGPEGERMFFPETDAVDTELNMAEKVWETREKCIKMQWFIAETIVGRGSK